MREKVVESLEEIWPLQAELNKRAGFDTAGIGKQLAAGEGGGSSSPGDDIRTQAGRALKNYLDALAAECHELQECLSWKHWYREAKTGKQYQLQDVQNARVEAADMLFFWISICQLLGLEPADVYRLYSKKLEVNHRRQDENRAQNEHGSHEKENREVV
jgi:NTP pyrophosphatase (non-canonical NTP hydrolase)